MSYDGQFGVQLRHVAVSIPLEQGSVLRQRQQVKYRLNFGSQSLWNRAVSYDVDRLCATASGVSLNPFGTGQCLTTAVGSSSLVRQGLPKPLPNFFRDSESWVLIWLNFEQVLTFHLHIKRSKT